MGIQHWFKARVHELDQQECLELLANHPVGRIVFEDEHGPLALPVNYTLDGADVLLATSAYGSIARSVEGKRVAFEVDDVDTANEAGWSVLVRGRATQAEYLDLPIDPANRPYPWAEGARAYIVRIEPTSVTGRRLIPA